MGQIWDFSRSNSVHFSSPSENVLKSNRKKFPICPILGQSYSLWAQIWIPEDVWPVMLTRVERMRVKSAGDLLMSESSVEWKPCHRLLLEWMPCNRLILKWNPCHWCWCGSPVTGLCNWSGSPVQILVLKWKPSQTGTSVEALSYDGHTGVVSLSYACSSVEALSQVGLTGVPRAPHRWKHW